MRENASRVEFVGSFPAELPTLGIPEVAFAGRSNVGKSSALNCLLGSKKVARVSSTPGRTQAVNLFRIGPSLSFADLPGYGFAKVPDAVKEEWRGMIEKYLALRTDLRMVVLLVDIRRTPQELDEMLIDALAEMELPTLVVATKADKLTRNERFNALKALEKGFGLPPEALVAFSSLTGEGKDEVWDRIEAVCRA